tara:strand:+ start:99 stop:359 length:261 start_codon:yes stop_codon:yes gene_type:complete
MKAYRFQVRYSNLYFDGIALGSDADNAAENFAEMITSKKILPKDEAFRDKGLHITYEEIDRNVTASVDIEKVAIGVEVGNAGSRTG